MTIFGRAKEIKEGPRWADGVVGITWLESLCRDSRRSFGSTVFLFHTAGSNSTPKIRIQPE